MYKSPIKPFLFLLCDRWVRVGSNLSLPISTVSDFVRIWLEDNDHPEINSYKYIHCSYCKNYPHREDTKLKLTYLNPSLYNGTGPRCSRVTQNGEGRVEKIGHKLVQYWHSWNIPVNRILPLIQPLNDSTQLIFICFRYTEWKQFPLHLCRGQV